MYEIRGRTLWRDGQRFRTFIDAEEIVAVREPKEAVEVEVDVRLPGGRVDTYGYRMECVQYRRGRGG